MRIESPKRLSRRGRVVLLKIVNPPPPASRAAPSPPCVAGCRAPGVPHPYADIYLRGHLSTRTFIYAAAVRVPYVPHTGFLLYHFQRESFKTSDGIAASRISSCVAGALTAPAALDVGTRCHKKVGSTSTERKALPFSVASFTSKNP